MRKSLIIAAISLTAALGACSKPAPEAAPSEAASTAAADAAAASIPTGVFEVTDAKGKKVATTTINADGTYAEDMADGHRVAGIVKMVDGKTCFDPSGKAEAECYTDSAPAADGSFTATDAKGIVVTVTPKK